VSVGFVIEALRSHDRAGFDCGAPALDRYLREQASQDVKRMISSCFVAKSSETGALAGYYTLSATSVSATELPPELLRKLPRYPVLPAALIGRLAVDRRFARAGLGGALLADAAMRTARAELKAFALVVEAKDENATAFYQRHGFQSFRDSERSLFLPLGTIAKVSPLTPPP
jgi:ribosomal protein S18 acetylase RimI-like enzyme